MNPQFIKELSTTANQRISTNDALEENDYEVLSDANQVQSIDAKVSISNISERDSIGDANDLKSDNDLIEEIVYFV